MTWYGTLRGAGPGVNNNLPPGLWLPAGHYLPRIQPLVVEYPRPDTETHTFARHHWAFYSPNAASMLCDFPVDVIGGAYPHVPVLVSGPPGAQILLPNYAAGPPYGSPRFQWTPTATWSGTVVINWYSQEYQTDNTQYITQSFSHSTSPSIAETNPLTDSPGVFIFANADTGSSSNTGAYDDPIDDWPTASGTTYAAAPTIGGVPTAGLILVLMGGTTNEYTLPLYVDGDNTWYEPDNSTKPTSVIGFPGLPAPIFSAATASADGVATSVINFSVTVDDAFYSYLNPDGYNADNIETRLFSVGGSGLDRITIDSIEWTNSGYGTLGTDNSSILESSNYDGLRQYIYCNNCSEPSRQSGDPGNNFAGPDYYSVQYGLIQGYSCDNPSFTGDSGCLLKVDCENTEIRGCYYNTSNTLYPCSTGESVLVGFTTCDITYCLLIGCNNPKNPALNSGEAGVQTICRIGRCNVISPAGVGILAGTPNTGAGPFYVTNNVAQGPNVSVPVNGTDNINSSGNTFSTSDGLLNTTTGMLTGEYANSPSNGGILGIAGCQISAAV